MVFDDTSGGGHAAYVARLLRAELVTDSSNADPATKVGQFNEYRPPARPFVTPYASGIRLEVDCGDCLSDSFFFSRPGRIATVTYSLDDDEPQAMKKACQLARSARSFRWSRSSP